MTSADNVPEIRTARLTPRGKVLLPLGLAILVALTVHRFFFADPPTQILEFSGPTMGTTYTVKVASAFMSPERRSEVAAAIAARLDEVNALMSTYDPDSELSRFNRFADTTAFSISGPTLEVLVYAAEIARRSKGAFDVTVGPLVEAWGFGPEGVPERRPSGDELESLASRVGYRHLSIDTLASAVRKRVPGVEIDLSAIAKGYGVDRVASVLDDQGFTDYLVEVGGELRGRGSRPDGRAWRIAIEVPDPERRSPFRAMDLLDLAVATSGDYRNYYEADGVRYSHIIDPRTGAPIEHRGASVTVVHAVAAVADGWATALSVLGPDEGSAVAEREGIAALFVVKRGEEFVSIPTSRFPPTFAAGG